VCTNSTNKLSILYEIFNLKKYKLLLFVLMDEILFLNFHYFGANFYLNETGKKIEYSSF